VLCSAVAELRVIVPVPRRGCRGLPLLVYA